MTSRPSFFRTATTAGLVAAAFAILAQRTAGAEDTLARVKSQSAMNVGFANETPFAYATAEGELTGLDIEVLRHIANEMGVKELHGGLTAFGGLIPGLKAGRFDIIASAVYIKPDRCQQVAFAEPMYILGDGIAVPKGNPRNIHSYADVAKQASFKLAYTAGATGVTDHVKAMGVADSQLIPVPEDTTGYAALDAGRVDGYATTGIILETQLRARNDPKIERATPFEQSVVDGKRLYGIASFAVRLGDKDFLVEINKYLLQYRDTPEYKKLLEKYGLGPDDEVQPGMTAAKACAG